MITRVAFLSSNVYALSDSYLLVKCLGQVQHLPSTLQQQARCAGSARGATRRVQHHLGAMTCRSEPARTSTTYACLPCSVATAAAAARGASVGAGSRPRRRCRGRAAAVAGGGGVAAA
jgi:hypothetical protein